ncbi:MAG TPA: hypothetical protein VMY78_07820 [Solirubrobacteraceae bacterium]|nr:hypothetical protein [Solirubrobacteraceae bacterium]
MAEHLAFIAVASGVRLSAQPERTCSPTLGGGTDAGAIDTLARGLRACTR